MATMQTRRRFLSTLSLTGVAGLSGALHLPAAAETYALRMREAGLIKSAPQKIIAQGTDWRFLDELKRELKA